MTEDEAKTKWCFAAVASHTDPRGGFRENESQPAYLQFPCIGGACMAWRERREWRWQGGEWATLPLQTKEPDVDTRIHGYCGLAGAPHDPR